jgi:hypothetical protein
MRSAKLLPFYFILSVFFLIFIIVSPAFSQQTWQRTYGGETWDDGLSVQQTSDGGYVVTGTTNSFGAGNWDVYLIKSDANGDTVWTRTYGGANDDRGYSVQQTLDGGYIISGWTNSFGAGSWDAYLIKTNVNGDTVWTRTYGGANYEWGALVQQTLDGGYIIAGSTSSFGAGSYDLYLIKTNANGDTLWTQTFGGASWDYGSSVWQTSDGGYIIAGYTNSFGAGNDDVYLIKTNTSGDTLWTKTFGADRFDYGYSVQQTSDNGYIVAGSSSSFSTGGPDVYLIKTNANGDTLWTKTYGGADDDGAESVQEIAGGGYIITGWTKSFGAGSDDLYLIKTNASGDTLWTKTYGGVAIDWGYAVRRTSDWGYIVAGLTESFGAGGYDVYLVKADANGNVGIEDKSVLSPDCGSVFSVFPNPFSDKIVIKLPLSTMHLNPSIRIYDATGRLVKDFSKLLSSHTHEPSSITWQGYDDFGRQVPTGAYFIRLQSGHDLRTVRIMLLK